jgi:Skp family chaperone for outer membrane proteins
MRAVLWMGSVVVALAAVIGASRLWAEDKEKKPAPRTRIGLVNLTYVIKNYDKFKDFQLAIKELAEPFQQRDAELRAKLKELYDQTENSSLLPTAGEEGDKKATKEEREEKSLERLLTRPTAPSGKKATKGEREEKAKKIKRQIEDNSEEAKIKLSTESDQEMKIIYLDITVATQGYAVSHDLDLVLHYNDAVTKEDYVSAQSIARRLNTGGLMPLYSKQGMDISIDIVTLLNQKMHKK